MSNLEKNAAFANVDDLLTATMEELEGLPPLAIPPTGLYTLEVSINREEVNGKDALITKYKVIGISEVSNPDEAGEVQLGQLFQNGTYTVTKEGKPNTTGIGAFKDSLVPFAQHFFGDAAASTSIGAVIEKVQELQISATVKRRLRKDSEDQYNFRISNIIVL